MTANEWRRRSIYQVSVLERRMGREGGRKEEERVGVREGRRGVELDLPPRNDELCFVRPPCRTRGSKRDALHLSSHQPKKTSAFLSLDLGAAAAAVQIQIQIQTLISRSFSSPPPNNTSPSSPSLSLNLTDSNLHLYPSPNQVVTDRFATTNGSVPRCVTSEQVFCGGSWGGISAFLFRSSSLLGFQARKRSKENEGLLIVLGC